MHNKYLDETSKYLKEEHNIDVVKDIILARKDRLIMFSDTSKEVVELVVISGNLSDYGFEDKSSIMLQDIIERFDNSNKYAEVAGQQEYFNNAMKELLDFTKESNITIPVISEGNRIWIRINVVPIDNTVDKNAFFITDVTKYLIEEELIFEKTHKDSLTGLFNKYTLDYHYGERNQFKNFHALYFDLDDFKVINDTYGHVTGNDYLVAFANILKSFENNYNRFYRIGGDEFVGFLFEDPDTVKSIANKIVRATRNISTDTCKHGITVSIGIAKANKAVDLIRKADKVLYEVKESGKNKYLYKEEDEI